MTRSLPLAQHGSGPDVSSAEALERAPTGEAPLPQPSQDAERR
jgi:hypothetical protein